MSFADPNDFCGNDSEKYRYRGYGAYQNKLEDTYNIAVRNVVSRSKNAVGVVGGLSDSVIENIKWFYCEGEYGRSNYTNANFVNCKTNE